MAPGGWLLSPSPPIAREPNPKDGQPCPRTTQVGSELAVVQASTPPAPDAALPKPWEASAPQGHAYQGVDELSPGLARAPDGQSRASLCGSKESMSMSIRATSTDPATLQSSWSREKNQKNQPPTLSKKSHKESCRAHVWPGRPYG